MSKKDFLEKLRIGLSGLPREDREERLTFYSEMIEDRIEEGLSEDDAVAQIGPIDEIIAQIISDTPFAKIAQEKIRTRKRMGVWNILFLILGSPLWLSLLIAIFAVILSLYITLWSVIVSLWALFAAFAGTAFGCIAAGIFFVCEVNTLAGICLIAGGCVCAGLAIFLFYGCKAAGKGTVCLTKKITRGTKNRFAYKENAS